MCFDFHFYIYSLKFGYFFHVKVLLNYAAFPEFYKFFS